MRQKAKLKILYNVKQKIIIENIHSIGNYELPVVCTCQTLAGATY